MERYEKISFLVPFNSSGDLLVPQTTYEVESLPSEVKINVAVGFVNLKPMSSYKLNITIFPDSISFAVGDSIDMSSYPTEIASMDIKTKGTLLSDPVSGSVNVNMDKVKIVAKGSYRITATMFEGDSEVHSQTSYFYSKITK